jgi:hypothetical protein
MRGIRLVYKCLCAAILSLILIPSVPAQTSSTGALSGTVTDQTGSVIANATVTATSATGQVRTGTTGSNGSYDISLLASGDYRVKFEANGFGTLEVPSVTVIVTETEVLNESLQVGTSMQKVTVQSNVETIQTESSTVGTVVSGQVMVDIPLSTRNYTNLLAFASGANSTVQNATAMGKGSSEVAVNGASTAQNSFMMDGVTIENVGSNNDLREFSAEGSIAIPDPDSLQEFKIQTSNFDASYGMFSGGSVNAVTKSGTDDFHGTVFEFFRNTVLNANDFFLNQSHDPEGVLNQNQYGGTLGGPIKKKKLYFFGSFQETWQKNGYSPLSLSTGVILPPLPTGNRGTCPPGSTAVSQCDSATQTFVAGLGANICGTSSSPQSVANSAAGSKPGAPVGTQVACDGSNISAPAVQIFQLKLPNGNYYIPGSGSSTYSGPTAFSTPAWYTEHQYMANWDYLINTNNTLSGRYFYSDDPTRFPFQNEVTSGASLFVPGLGGTSIFTNHVATLRLTSLLSPTTVNEAHISYQRDWSVQNGANSFSDSQVGITPLQPSADILPYFGITGLMSFGDAGPATTRFQINEFVVGDTLSWSHGKHSIRVGFEGTHELWRFDFAGISIGQLTISSFADFLLGLPGCVEPGPACTASQAAGLSNGTPFSSINALTTTVRSGDLHYFPSHTAAGFVQDDFKVNSRLTLNLGVRWEYFSPWTEKFGGTSGLWTSLINTAPVPGSGCLYNNYSWGLGATGTGCSFVGLVAPANYSVAKWGPIPTGVYQNNTDGVSRNATPWDNFAPRLGFAWQPLPSNSRLVVRGGFGYFYNWVIPGQVSGITTQEPPSGVPFTLSGTSLFSSSLAAPFPTQPLGWEPRWVNFANGTSSILSFGGNNGTPSQSFLTPLVYQYGLNTQYEFLPGWVLEVGYVGSHGIHQELTDYPDGSQLASAADPVNGITTSTVSGTGGPNLRVPYLGFAPTLHFSSTLGSFLYNGLQTTVRKSFTRSLTMQVAYSWSRAFILTEVQNPEVSFAENVPVIKEYGLNPSYHPQRVTASYDWSLPFGHHEGLKEKLIDGWTLSGVTTIQDGTPLTITDGRGGSVLGSPLASNAELSGTGSEGSPGSLHQRVLGNYFNKAYFTTTPLAANLAGCSACSGTLPGDAPLGSILGPGQNNWDISLSKMTKVGGLREDATLQFRAEFYNTFNHAQFNNPTTAFNSSAFGTITGSSVNPRLMEFALKYAF